MDNFLSRSNLEYFSRRLNTTIPSDLSDLTNMQLNRFTRLHDIGGYVPEASNVFYVNTGDVNAVDDNLDPLQGYSWSKPFKTIQYAINRVKTQLALPNVTINVAPGTYNETLSISGIFNIDIIGRNTNNTGADPETVIIDPGSVTKSTIDVSSCAMASISRMCVRGSLYNNGAEQYHFAIIRAWRSNVILSYDIVELRSRNQFGLLSSTDSYIGIMRERFTIRGSVSSHILRSDWNSTIGLESFVSPSPTQGIYIQGPMTIYNNGLNSVAGSGALVQGDCQGNISVIDVQIGSSGTITGKKYELHHQSMLTEVSKLPNTTIAGTVATGSSAA